MWVVALIFVFVFAHRTGEAITRYDCGALKIAEACELVWKHYRKTPKDGVQ